MPAPPVIAPRRRPVRRIVRPYRRGEGTPLHLDPRANVHAVLVPGGAGGRLREAFYHDRRLDLWQLPPRCQVQSTHNTIPFVGAKWMAYQCADANSVSVLDTIQYGDSVTAPTTSDTGLGNNFGDEYAAQTVIDEAAGLISFRHILEGTEHLADDVKEMGIFSNGSGFTIDSYAGDNVMIARAAGLFLYSPSPTADDDLLVVWDFTLAVGSGMCASAGQTWILNRLVDPSGYAVPDWFVWGTDSAATEDDAMPGEVARTRLDATPTVTTSSPDWAQAEYRSDYGGSDEIFQTGIALTGAVGGDVLFSDLATGIGAGESGPISNREHHLRFNSG